MAKLVVAEQVRRLDPWQIVAVVVAVILILMLLKLICLLKCRSNNSNMGFSGTRYFSQQPMFGNNKSNKFKNLFDNLDDSTVCSSASLS